jgi:hypothetical protein
MSSTALEARALIGDKFASIVQTIHDANPDTTAGMADRIADQGIAFVVACAKNPGIGMAPSRVVDEGWHALLMHSALYRELCARFGTFVDHYPGYDPTHYDPEILDRTRILISMAGFEIDDELWRAPDDELVSVSAKCQHAPSCAIRPMPKPDWP